jgi:hypothetical protein
MHSSYYPFAAMVCRKIWRGPIRRPRPCAGLSHANGQFRAQSTFTIAKDEVCRSPRFGKAQSVFAVAKGFGQNLLSAMRRHAFRASRINNGATDTSARLRVRDQYIGEVLKK